MRNDYQFGLMLRHKRVRTMTKDNYNNSQKIRVKRSEGLQELVDCYTDLEDILYMRDKNMNWLQKKYFSHKGKQIVKNYELYEWVNPEIQLEAYNCVYEQTLAKFPKLKHV